MACIADIKNKYIRRTVLLISFIPIYIAVTIYAMCSAICEVLSEVEEQFIKGWKGK